MNTPTEENLFEITLSQQGTIYILRTYRIIRWFSTMVAIIAIMAIISLWLRIDRYQHYDTSKDWMLFVELRIFPVIWSVAIFFSIANAFAYARFTILCKRAIETRQADLFNDSLKWLVRNARIACTLCAINLLSTGFELYAEITLHTKGVQPA